VTKTRFIAAALIIMSLVLVGNTVLNIVNHSETSGVVKTLRLEARDAHAEARDAHHEAAAARAEVARARAAQREGEPIAVCLLDVMSAVKPLLIRAPNVELPLSAYVELDEQRYPHGVCPVHQH